MKILKNFIYKTLKINTIIFLFFNLITIKSQILDNEDGFKNVSRDYPTLPSFDSPRDANFENLPELSISTFPHASGTIPNLASQNKIGPTVEDISNLAKLGPSRLSPNSAFESVSQGNLTDNDTTKEKTEYLQDTLGINPSEIDKQNNEGSPLFSEPFQETRMLPTVTAADLQDYNQEPQNNYTNAILFFLFGITILVVLYVSLNDIEKIKLSIVSVIGVFAITATITHIWTVIIAFTISGFWGGLLTLSLPFLGELYWMIKMFGINNFYAYTALVHLIFSIPVFLLKKNN